MLDDFREEMEALTSRHELSAFSTNFLIHSDSNELRSLSFRFVERIVQLGMDDISDAQVCYAYAIASTDRIIEYEEMHKLLSLCDEIRALECLGLKASKRGTERLRVALRKRFDQQPEVARLSAEDCVDYWNRNFWWYSENIESSKA